MKNIIIYYCLLVALLFFSACTDESTSDHGNIIQGDEPIQLSGIVTRADGDPRNIYIKAFLPGAQNAYFNETLANMPSGLSVGNTTSIVFPGVPPYYPLGDTNEILIFGYSGKTQGTSSMVLTAGTGINNDAVLSNYGKRKNDPGVVESYAPLGTPGSSANPAQVLQFRHVMTQLNVEVVVNTSESTQVDPAPSNISFTMPGVVATGHYGIRTLETDVAITTSGTYTVKRGINYLVPTGENLATERLTSLIIDDYIATADDLSNLSIEPTGNEMTLMPGYAYNLTFNISRLRVQSITLRKTNWVPHEETSNVSYTPYTLDLGFDADGTGQVYSNTGDEAIDRVVLRTADRTYVGQSEAGSTTIGFVLLPTSGVTNVSLYTQKGLLIDMDIPPTGYTYNPTGSSSLNLQISEGGMLPVNPTQPYDATNNPYAVTTPLQFMNVSYDTNASYRQLNTIDLTTLNLVDAGRIFNGFGAFSGTYDGNGNRIDGVDIQASGLFASNSGTIRGVRLTTGTVDASGLTTAGSICGTNTGVIVGCINEARLIAGADDTIELGGICGSNSGSIIGCLNTGTVLNGTTVGGICGNNESTAPNAIVACINTGMMNPEATNLGYILGASTSTGNIVVNTCYGLVGSAQRVIGGPETAVGSGTVGTVSVASLEPAAIRGQVTAIPIQSSLETAMNNTSWGTAYEYIFDHSITSVTWPAPIPR